MLVQQSKPTESQIVFEVEARKRLRTIVAEILDSAFWAKDPSFRLMRIKEGFAVYFEIFQDASFQKAVENQMVGMPNGQKVMKELIPCVRNLLLHFPLFDSWNGVRFSKSLINWKEPYKSIDKFFTSHEGSRTLSFQINVTGGNWILNIAFPTDYSKGKTIKLKDVIPELLGVKFFFFVMQTALDLEALPDPA